MIKRAISAVVFLAVSNFAHAQCYGTGTFKTCYDDSGNTYSVNKIGNTTYLNGSNASTGSNWSQTSTTIGNTTYTNGQAANGNSWNSTQINSGFGTTTFGTDSNGRTFNNYQPNTTYQTTIKPFSLYE